MDDAEGGRPRHQRSGAVLGHLGLTISRSAGVVFPARTMVVVQASLLLLLLVGCVTPDWRGSGQQARDRQDLVAAHPEWPPENPRSGGIRGDQRRNDLGYGACGMGTPRPCLIQQERIAPARHLALYEALAQRGRDRGPDRQCPARGGVDGRIREWLGGGMDRLADLVPGSAATVTPSSLPAGIHGANHPGSDAPPLAGTLEFGADMLAAAPQGHMRWACVVIVHPLHTTQRSPATMRSACMRTKVRQRRRMSDIIVPDHLIASPSIPITAYRDACRHILPLPEHSGTLLHWIPGRYRYTPPYGPIDFAAWFEAYLGGHWYIFDARNNVPRAGRVLIARGRDAADVPISNTFGPNTLRSFKVWAEKVSGGFP